MYKVIKPKGLHNNVTLENTDTKANIILGRISVEMLDILEKAGHKIASKLDEGETDMNDVWDITVDTETASKLATLTMKIKKPVREQKTEEQATPIIKEQEKTSNKLVNKGIDAMDVLLGLTNYV